MGQIHARMGARWVIEMERLGIEASFQQFRQHLLNQDAAKLNPRMFAELQSQRDQVPQAFALGDPVGNLSKEEYHAPNIGIFFRVVPVGNALGAELTRDPDPGSGAAQLLLEPGDTIYNLDSLPIRHAVDVMNHHGRTDVSFINVRTNGPQAGVMVLPPFTPLPADVPPENYAANLGIHYQLIPYEGGTLGAAQPHRLRKHTCRGDSVGAGGHDHPPRRSAHPKARGCTEPHRPNHDPVR